MAGEFVDSAEDYGVTVPRMDGSNLQETNLVAGPLVVDKCLSRMFAAAYLLTGSTKQAEAAMLESIRQLDIQATRGGCLSWKAIAGAIMRGNPDAEQTPDETPATLLPVELRRVLHLPPSIRQCFVLRFLMAMPGQHCAGLLRMDAQQVDANSHLAARELANMVAAEAANRGALAALWEAPGAERAAGSSANCRVL